jgi:glycosyltransferase involved in cell wall biosynthesis
VPERYGPVSLDLMNELKHRGFGVGVHGLKHDGKLFSSKRVFEESAVRINRYLKEWGTRGFYSPSMHHNLAWMAGLNIDYSTSTFDTDPFEPQPDAAGTIFPFWVKNGNTNRRYMELPYTLAQDATLFIILREKSIDIWKEKLEWIVSHGGMALLNTHPDYMSFDGECQNEKYPVAWYREFLNTIKFRYAGLYFHALSRELAGQCDETCLHPVHSFQPLYATEHILQEEDSSDTARSGEKQERISVGYDAGVQSPERSARPLRVCMVAYSFYEGDNRVRRYAESLARRGDEVDVISLRREGQTPYGDLNGVRIFRIQQRTRDEKGKFDYLWRIIKFFFRSAFDVSWRHILKPYDIIHVHSVPDFEVFAALVPKLFGAKIILDIHDIVPELYCSKFGVRSGTFVFTILVLIERLSIWFSDHTIISNDLWRERLVTRSVKPEKCTSIINYPDENLFCNNCNRKIGDNIVLLYPGTLNAHQGLDIAIKAFSRVKDVAQNSSFHIYGEGPSKEELKALIRDLDLGGRVFLNDPVTLDEIVNIMSQADIGIIPKHNDGFGGEAFSTKSLEFMIMGVPVIMARTRIDNYYFNAGVVRFFEPGNVEDLSGAMAELIRDASLRSLLGESGALYAQKQVWGVKSPVYLNLLNSLIYGNYGKLHK